VVDSNLRCHWGRGPARHIPRVEQGDGRGRSDLPNQVVLLDVRQDMVSPAPIIRIVGVSAAVWQNSNGIMVVVGGQADLLEIVRALHPIGCLADFLDRWQK